jgi:hypothetical protein
MEGKSVGVAKDTVTETQADADSTRRVIGHAEKKS